ncbi:hypothetical protein TeGR_g1892, partial [Tetraparma gracilis]
LVVQTSLAVYMGWLSEENFSSAEFEQQENQASGWMETTQVALFLCTALYSITHLFNSVVYWRASVTNLVDLQEGTVDPLAALNKFPAAKRLMQWYNDNFAIHTAGRYSFLLIVGAEAFEFMVQTYNANKLAAFLDWTDQKLYVTLIFTNFLVFGLCSLTPERYVSSSVIITFDVLFDAAYIMFNIFYVENPTSYWAIIAPLFLSVDMLNDSVLRQAHEMVLHHLEKQATLKMFDESKARGTYPEDACLHLLRLLDSGSKNGRIEVPPPSGYDVFKPLMFLQKSEGAEVVTGILEFVLPGVTAGQAFTYFSRYSPDDRGTGEQAVLEVMSSDYRVVHGTPHPDPLNVVLALRDVCLDHVWTKLEYFKNGIAAGGMCGFGVDQNPNKDAWVLDASGCGLEELGEWKEEYADLEVLDLSDNELVELPLWLREGKMGKLRELKARGNVIEKGLEEVFGSWSGCEAGKDCAECEAGKSSATGRGDCGACPSGTYAEKVGATTCASCAAGRYSALEGAAAGADCLPCEPGTASAPGSSVCDPCTLGRYADEMGAEECTSCGAGKYGTMERAASADACVECEGGWSLAGSAGSALCKPCSGGVCLKGPMDWHSARAECLSLGTDLPIVLSDEANEVLANAAAQFGANSIWLGATDEEVEGEWVWVDGTPVNFTRWDMGQPNDWGSQYGWGPGEDFASLITARTKWHDLSVAHQRMFVCEVDFSSLHCPPSSQPDLVNGGCEPCPAGTASDTTNSEPCKLISCDDGTFLYEAADGAECRPCPVGTYKDDSSASPCVDCPADTFNPSEASTSVADCAACPSSHPTSANASVVFASCKLPAEKILTTTLMLLDLRNNSIPRMPYEVMDVESPELTILLDGTTVVVGM